jgi:tetratricopeptide (TPR) repeat protein
MSKLVLDERKSQNSTEDWEALYAKLDSLTIDGQHQESRKLLKSINPKKIERPWAVKFSEIAFRLNEPLFTLKALQNILFPENSFLSDATNKEKVIYSSALSSLGAFNTSLEILSGIDSEIEPEALFYTASAHVYQWNYLASIPYFKSFIRSKSITPYRRLVAKVNLASAYIFLSDWDSAAELINETITECKTNNYSLLLGNCYELKAQFELFQGRYEEALNFLELANEILQAQGGFYLMFVEKWKIFCLCQLKRNQTEELKKFDELRNRAKSLSHWGSIREFDLLESIVSENEELFKKVIMGTTSESYRQRARRLYGKKIISRGKFSFTMYPEDNEKKSKDAADNLIEFDPYKKNGHGEALFEKPTLLNVFDVLTQDFYQPSTIGMLFQGVFPTEKFNPFTSPARVLQLLRRLNHWFKAQNWPLEVKFIKSEFQLSALEPVVLSLRRGEKLSTYAGKISVLKEAFKDRSFTIRQVESSLEVSKETTERLLKEAFTNGDLTKQGKNRGLTYRFAQKREKVKVAS